MKNLKLIRADLPNRPLVQYGSYALKALNDNKDPGIDLLVREAVQNSADAALKNSGTVSIDFDYREFDTLKLRGILDDEALDRLKYLNHGGSKGISLEIRDTGTRGLGGYSSLSKVPTDEDGNPYEENFGNFIKLTQCIGQAQNQVGAGGSFGVGKTVFYRVSMAPVMFYSRFKEDNGTYRERLIFCFFEDQTEKYRKYSLLKNPTGFAWWGEKQVGNDETPPCEDETKIQGILKKIGIEPFLKKETGTSVFMPMLRKAQLPTAPQGENGDIATDPYWLPYSNSSKIEELIKRHSDYTKIALERWYAPRIDNPGYAKGAKLQVRVNGRKVTHSLPLFKAIKNLYNLAENPDDKENPLFGKAKLLEFPINSTFADNDRSPGRLAVIRLPKYDLTGEDGTEPSANIQLENHVADSKLTTHKPIIGLVRKPGMIVSYEREGPYVSGIPEDNDHFLVGVFVLRGDARLESKFNPIGDGEFNLEEHVRRNEPPAHNKWEEEEKIKETGFQPTFFNALKRGIRENIRRELYNETEVTNAESNVSALASKIAKMILPSGFGTVQGKKRSGTRTSDPSKLKRDTILIRTGEPTFLSGNRLKIGFNINTGESNAPIGAKRNFKLNIYASNENSGISHEKWEKELEGGADFPFEFAQIGVAKSTGEKGKSAALGHNIIGTGKQIKKTLEVILSMYEVTFITEKRKEELEGEIEIKVRDNGFLPLLKITEV